ncbi:MAG: AtpZ/AtpI family protein [Syntrophobacterales bacterium]|nr:AtpZ/AtpI family protein [Syntrophobacterales bacterium]
MDKESRKAYVQMAYASSIGFAFVLLIFGGLFVGNWLDKKMGTSFFFTVLLFIMGVVGGFRNLYVLISKSFQDDKIIIKSIKSEPHRKRPVPAKA